METQSEIAGISMRNNSSHSPMHQYFSLIRSPNFDRPSNMYLYPILRHLLLPSSFSYEFCNCKIWIKSIIVKQRENEQKLFSFCYCSYASLSGLFSGFRHLSNFLIKKSECSFGMRTIDLTINRIFRTASIKTGNLSLVL